MSDTFWLNLRYTLIAIGSSLLMKAASGYLTPDQAASLVTPFAELIIGALTLLSTWVWGNVVKWGTKTVSNSTGARSDVPTVNAATGASE